MPKPYDVIIVGAGPTGIFAAYELLKDTKLNILILELGRDISERECPIIESKMGCIKCRPCHTLSGWGGAGAFSDGKLLLDMTGGFLYRNRKRLDKVRRIIKDINECYLSHGAPQKVYGIPTREARTIQQKTSRHGLRFIPAKVRHLGTDVCYDVLKSLRDELGKKVRIEFNTQVETILTDGSKVLGVKITTGKEYHGSTLLLCPGRGGAGWLRLQAQNLGLNTYSNPLDIGVRVEVPKNVTSPLTDLVFESKFIYKSSRFNDKVRTFCMCPGGEVVPEFSMGVVTVNGHGFAHKETENTNFAVLVSTDLNSEDPSHLWNPPKLNSNGKVRPEGKQDMVKSVDPIYYGKALAYLANLMGGVVVQRLGDLQEGRTTNIEGLKMGKVKPSYKGASPGDLGLLIPWRYLHAIMEMLEALDKVLPGIGSPDTLLYGLEVKFYSSRLELSDDLETKVKGLFAAGDGAGISRGLVQASVSGILAAKGIKKRLQNNQVS